MVYVGPRLLDNIKEFSYEVEKVSNGVKKRIDVKRHLNLTLHFSVKSPGNQAISLDIVRADLKGHSDESS